MEQNKLTKTKQNRLKYKTTYEYVYVSANLSSVFAL